MKTEIETKIIDGRKMREKILEGIKKEVSKLSFQPVFCDVLIGEDFASKQYVEMKAKIAEKVGMKFYKATFKEDLSPEVIIEEIKKIKEVPNISGVIIQLPLPERFNQYKKEILDSVPEELDVDCLGTKASKKFYNNTNDIGFPTALACLYILDSLFSGDTNQIDTIEEDGKTFSKENSKNNLKNKKIIVLGQGELVGKPVSALLRFRGLNPVILTSRTDNNEAIIKTADIIISGIGKGKYLKGNMIKKGAILIDAGTSESNGGIIGDIDMESMKGVAGFLSPVPGGVGPVTVGILLENVLKVAEKLELKK